MEWAEPVDNVLPAAPIIDAGMDEKNVPAVGDTCAFICQLCASGRSKHIDLRLVGLAVLSDTLGQRADSV